MQRIKRGWHEEFEYHGRLSNKQKRRRTALIKDGLDPKIAHQFVFFDFKLAYMRRFRAILQRGITANPWATFRRVYESAIVKGKGKGKRGGYKPPARDYDSSKPHKTKEQAKEQAKRARERAKTGKGQYVYDGEGKPPKYIGEIEQDKKTGQFGRVYKEGR